MNQKHESYDLHITKNIYKFVMEDLQGDMTETLHVPFLIDSQLKIRDSCTMYSPKTGLATGVIIKPYEYDNNLISDESFLLMVNSFFHEYRHVEQSRIAVNENNSIGKDMACAMIAEQYNNDFYMKDYYHSVPNESDAELYSLKEERDFLHNVVFANSVRAKNIDRVMTDFINQRLIDKNCTLACIHRLQPYNNWQEILGDINGNTDSGVQPAYERIQTAKMQLASTYDLLRFGQASNDMIVPILLKRPDIIDILDNAENIREKCEIMASLVCAVIPEAQTKFTALDNVDLSVKTICKTEFTDKDCEVVNEIRMQYDRHELQNKNDINVQVIREYPFMDSGTTDSNENQYDD